MIFANFVAPSMRFKNISMLFFRFLGKRLWNVNYFLSKRNQMIQRIIINFVRVIERVCVSLCVCLESKPLNSLHFSHFYYTVSPPHLSRKFEVKCPMIKSDFFLHIFEYKMWQKLCQVSFSTNLIYLIFFSIRFSKTPEIWKNNPANFPNVSIKIFEFKIYFQFPRNSNFRGGHCIFITCQLI